MRKTLQTQNIHNTTVASLNPKSAGLDFGWMLKFLSALFLSLSFSFVVEAQCTLNFDLGNDTLLDCGETVTLHAPQGLNTYNWSNGTHADSLVVSQAGTYYCSGIEILTNLVVNGDFELGDTGFISNYGYGSGGTYGLLTNEGEYAITSNTSLVHNNFSTLYDHTYGTAAGSMMVVNGSNVAGQHIWEQTVPVQQNTNYQFQTWAMSVTGSNPAELAFSINGVQIGSVFSLTSTTGLWQQFNTTWNSGTATTATIAIVNQNTAAGGNDFAIDDITFAGFCSYTDTVTVSYPSNPVLSIVGPDTVCEGEEVTYYGTVDIAGSDITWAPGGFVADTFSFVATNNTVVNAIATSPQNCTSIMQQKYLTVIPGIDIQASDGDTICEGSSAAISFTSSTNDMTFLWLPDSSTWQFRSVAPDTSTVYTVVATNSFGCADSDSVYIEVIEIPEVSFSADTFDLCEGDSVFVELQTTASSPTYFWGNAAGNTSARWFSPQADSILKAHVEENGCSSAQEQAFLDVHEIPEITTVVGATICPGEDFTLEAEASPNSATITWLPDFTTGETYSSSSDTGITYEVYAMTDYCVSDTVAVTVHIADSCDVVVEPPCIACECFLNIPNVFTPNRDGTNDLFYVVDETGTCIFSNYKINIYNRWGRLVWESGDHNAVWDGTNEGTQCDEGTYFWRLEATYEPTGRSEVKSGYITLLR